MSAILFLGTAGDSFVLGKHGRNAGGIIIQINENQLHIDPGPGALTSSKRCDINPRATTALLVSKNSLYTCGDLNAVIDAMTYSGFDKKAVLVANNEVINGPESFLLHKYRDYLERFIVLESGRKVGINEVEVQSITLSDKSIGFKLIAPEFTICYLPSTKYSSALEEQCKNSNILILNSVSPKKEDGFSSEDAIKLIKAVGPKLAILTNFGIKMIEADPLYEAREISKAAGVPTVAAKDGMVINPLSYSADQGQKTLRGF
ncbi:MAG: hypothetical protein KJ601_01395 [Nanoarchaeota archaeon]|nr:hypothetical protein [Nanoarchaeota archaeon]MBU1703799.1 hypothetical protein [Nanoarchaeota archaeon]